MKTSTSESYRKRLLKVVDYMHLNIDKSLDVNTLADVACMSPYHFHRIYREMAQETVNATVRRMRLQAAAAELIRSELSVQKIASNYHYGSVEAFSRAFSKAFGETPSSYRETRQHETPEWQPFIAMLAANNEITNAQSANMYQVEIVELAETHLIGMKHVGDYQGIGQAFEKVGQYAVSKEIMSDDTKFIGIYYDDPQSFETDLLKSMACVTGDKRYASTDASIEATTIPAGKYATLLFKGSYAELEKPYDWFFGQWLPNSGLEAGDFPPFEDYLNDVKTVAPSELLTKIHVLLSD